MGESLNRFKLMRTPVVDEKPAFLVNDRVNKNSGIYRSSTDKLCPPPITPNAACV